VLKVSLGVFSIGSLIKNIGNLYYELLLWFMITDCSIKKYQSFSQFDKEGFKAYMVKELYSICSMLSAI